MPQAKFVSTTSQDPSSLQAQLRLQREQELAGMLGQQADAPIDYDPRGGISWTQGAAKLLSGYLAGRQRKKVDEALEGVTQANQSQRDRETQALEAYRAAPAEGRDRALADLLAATGGPGAVAQWEASRMAGANAESFGQPEEVVGPDGQRRFVQFGTRGSQRPIEGFTPPAAAAPSTIQEWEAFQRMTPDQQRLYLEMKRSPGATVKDVAGVPTVVTPGMAGGAPSQVPLSTLGAEAGAAATTAGARAGAEATAKAEADRAATTQKQGQQAGGMLATLDLAEPLIEVATGSSAGAGFDKVAGFFGAAPDGAKATAQLRILQADLLRNVPRMEGPQSDADRLMYEQAVGQIGDPTIPREVRLAAVQTIRTLQRRYQAKGAAAQTSAQGASPAPQFRFNPQTQQLEAVNAGR